MNKYSLLNINAPQSVKKAIPPCPCVYATPSNNYPHCYQCNHYCYSFAALI